MGYSIGLLLYLVFNCIVALIMLYGKYLFRSVFLLLEHKLIEGREHVLVAYLFLIEIKYFRIVLDLHKSYKIVERVYIYPLPSFPYY